MALLNVIRRWRHRDKISIRQIAKRTGLSRNTVRKYLASGVVEPKYLRLKAPSKLDDYASAVGYGGDNTHVGAAMRTGERLGLVNAWQGHGP